MNICTFLSKVFNSSLIWSFVQKALTMYLTALHELKRTKSRTSMEEKDVLINLD